ncbi:MAG: phosphoglycerate mutase, partial [Clostridia bacterium]|nr:phosphoglycerate mutase [Clostridia bacterium]
NHHPINEARRARGLRPANSAWFWSPGKKPALPSFKEKFGLDAAVQAFKNGKDLFYVHVEGPDECGHRGETENKILSIESIDGKILAPVVSYLKETGEPFRVMCLPDHPTPIEIRTHSMEPVPFFIYDSEKKAEGPAHMDEDSAAATGLYVADGTRLMDMLLKK